jgi:hypothetical protein
MPFRRKTARLTVRPGATLELVLSGGECIRVSTPDPVAAALVITGQGHAQTSKAGRGGEDRDAQKGEHRA